MARLKFKRNQQKNLLKKFLEINGMTYYQASKTLCTGKTTFRDWLAERYNLPYNIFQKICQITPKLEVYKKEIEKELTDNWEQVKGGNVRILNNRNIINYLKKIRKIREEKRLAKKLSTKNINNKILDRLIKDKVDLLCVLSIYLLTDGSLTVDKNRYRISFYSKDEILKNFIKALVFKLSSYLPSEYIDKKDVFSVRVSDSLLARRLLKLSPSYKRRPSKNQTKENYLNELQPSVNFLKRVNENTLKWCIRFAFSTDGCISISKNNRAELNLRCYHPSLPLEWLDLLKKYDINVRLGRGKDSWCEINCVRTYDINSIENFSKIGGFVEGVKISNKSKYYKGLEKNIVLDRVIKGG